MILGPAQVLPFGPLTADLDAVNGAAIVHGWALRESTGTARAELDVCDGEHGPTIAPVTLCPHESVRDWFSGAAIYAVTGLYLRVRSGSVEGSLWFRPATVPSHVTPVDLDDLFERVVDSLWDGRR